MAYYEAGHMMYIHLPSLARLKEDLANFVTAASNLA
jgi:carboxypeptidase C (cathepsin A)